MRIDKELMEIWLNEVCDSILSQVQDLERVQFAYQSLPYWFCSEAEVIGADVLSGIPRHLRSLVVPRY